MQDVGGREAQEACDARVKTETKFVGGRDQTENGMGLGQAFGTWCLANRPAGKQANMQAHVSRDRHLPTAFRADLHNSRPLTRPRHMCPVQVQHPSDTFSNVSALLVTVLPSSVTVKSHHCEYFSDRGTSKVPLPRSVSCVLGMLIQVFALGLRRGVPETCEDTDVSTSDSCWWIDESSQLRRSADSLHCLVLIIASRCKAAEKKLSPPPPPPPPPTV